MVLLNVSNVKKKHRSNVSVGVVYVHVHKALIVGVVWAWVGGITPRDLSTKAV